MTTLTQNLNKLLIDREGAEISSQTEVNRITHSAINRDTQPFSELKNNRFRRLFNRHSIIR